MRPAFLLLLLAAGSLLSAERWRIAYEYGGEETLTLRDLCFAGPRLGLAAGALTDERSRSKGAGIATADGGRSWFGIDLPAAAAFLYCLDERAVWIGDGRGVWKSDNWGQSWVRLEVPEPINRVYFADENRGWATGPRKKVVQTVDGGKHWTPIEPANPPKTDKDHTFFYGIAFSGPRGMVLGASRPPRRNALPVPDWMDPRNAPRELPAVNIILETRDGGRTWSSSETSMFGLIGRVRLGADGRGLGLIEFENGFRYPSEVFAIDLRTGNSRRVFREETRAVTDVLFDGKGTAWLAAIEPPGQLAHSPVPGKVHVLRSDDLERWQELPVHYRAIATRAVLAEAASGELWIATDTGLILRLE